MSSEDTNLLEWLHIKVHALRMMDKYSPSKFEQELNRIIAERFSDSCHECKEKSLQLKYQPIQEKKEGFWGGLFK
jgi:hypothetical protein